MRFKKPPGWAAFLYVASIEVKAVVESSLQWLALLDLTKPLSPWAYL